MKEVAGESTEDISKARVAKDVELQNQNPTAIHNGNDFQKAFDVDTQARDIVKPRIDDASELTQSAINLAISTDDEMPKADRSVFDAEAEAGPDPESSTPPSHPNIEVLLPDGTRLDDAAASQPEGEDATKEDEDIGGAEVGFGQKKRKKRKPKSQRGLVCRAKSAFTKF